MSENHCADMVRRHDYQRYVMVLFAPQTSRAALFALYALHHEIAKIHMIVSEPMVGLIRMQWWRDTVKTAFTDKPAPHPVIQALHAVIHNGTPCQQHDVMALVDAYEPLLEYTDHPSQMLVETMDSIAESFVLLQNQAWFAQSDTPQSHTIMTAYLLSDYLKTVQKSTYDRLDMPYVIQSIHTTMPARQLPERLMKVIISMRMKILAKCGNDVFHPSFRKTDPLLPFKLWLKSKNS